MFGANWRQVESLAAQRDAQRFALEATYVTLASNVAAAAIQEASVRAQIEASRQIIAAEEKSLQILRDQFRLGYAMRIDVAAQEAALGQAKMLLPPLQEQLQQTRDLIRALVGNLPNKDVPETFDPDALQLPRELPSACPPKSSSNGPMCGPPRLSCTPRTRRSASRWPRCCRNSRLAETSAAMRISSPGCSAPAARSGP